MKASTFDWLPVLFLLLAMALALRSEPRQAACDNEQRYENQVMCAGVQFGYSAPYPDNCSLFLVCDCEYPTVKMCPAHLWWNNRTQICDWPQNTKCIYYNIPTTTGAYSPTPPTPAANTTQESRPTTEENWPTSDYDPPPPPPGVAESFCKNFKDGSVHRYPYDCNAYINCTHGWPVLNYCDYNKVFNQELLICDTPDTAHCEPLPLPSSTTTTTTEETTTTPPTTTTEETTITTTEETTTATEPTSTTEEGECSPPPLGIDEDYCYDLGNGFYEYPYNCSAYITCRNGCTNMAYCIPDKLFNPLWHICDTPNSVDCRPKPYPTTTTAATTSTTTTTGGNTGDTSSSSSGAETSTTPVPTEASSTTIATTTPALPADVNPNMCKDRPDDFLFPYAADCSKYLQCRDHQVIVGQCAPTLLFNPVLLICDSAEDVDCEGDRTTTPVTSTTTEAPTTTTSSTTTETTTPATTPGPAELCATEPLGTSYPYEQNCEYYILCMGDGEFYIARCISNTYFDPKTGECGPNVSPTACREQDATTTTTTAATTTTTTTTTKTTTEAVSTISTPTTSVATTPQPPGGICGNKDEGEMIAYPNDCSKYIVCVSPIPVGFYCTPGSYFSAQQQQCVSWEDSDCDKEMATTPGSGHTQAPLEPTMCTNSTRDTFPYPENCQWFIRCVNDYIYMMDVCNCGEYYDPISGKCGADVPSDACRWDYTSTTAATTTETTPEPTPPVTRPPPQKGPCDGAADGELVPYPNDCSKYIKCDRPIAAAYDCADGDEFSPEQRKCMEASLANCSVGTTPSWPGSTTASDQTTESTESPVSSTTTETSTTSETSSTTEPLTTTEISTTTEPQTTTEPPSTPSPSTTTESSTTPSTSTTTETLTTPESSTASEISPTTEPPTTATSSSSTAPESTTTEQTTTPAPSGGICGNKPNGSLVPYPNNCEKYIVCQEPIPIGYDCPEGLEFSPTELQCMDPELANCRPEPTTATAAPTSPATPTTTPLTTVATTTPSTPETTSTAIDTTSPSTPETSSTVIDTTTPITTEMPSSTTSATTQKTTTSASTTTSGPTTIHPDTPNICCGHPLGTILPYPNDCNRYVVCDYPIPYAVVCEEGMLFDVESLQCKANQNANCIFEEY
ncbi:PREDICTED: mucin-5AC [Drosophila arizonae]|uniref:Mucin-5AC n=1 Tax=Drosophila arizonae TaxID=7263 RepID=A0ABM1P0D3_DROAR|nr:PREDICTED: mucin-5AC [Drosophila arizonae]